ncbi:helix-turn-helix transcriptional regulator [Amycolatopsis rhabdoformis]|uniref:Helix-turn-helix transcriptional regulator n=1 Tax=Amycolatopsis rhabdoformis TaxID=1448059 RepID=A0ABZ1HW86_9PSEU|nr:helix-turn-helix transcriptional regulator [Amycolatopsis rhabdoformis]WSE26154.1 helix-turn-helix transcriptional regulator [Amycolatopsis rhabdoformis]
MPILRNLRAKRLELAVRRGRRITAREIAEQIGLSPSHYYNVEGGSQSASEMVATLLADALGCDVAELLIDAKKVPDKPPQQPQPKTTGPRKREQSDTKSPNRAHPESGAA